MFLNILVARAVVRKWEDRQRQKAEEEEREQRLKDAGEATATSDTRSVIELVYRAR